MYYITVLCWKENKFSYYTYFREQMYFENHFLILTFSEKKYSKKREKTHFKNSHSLKTQPPHSQNVSGKGCEKRMQKDKV